MMIVHTSSISFFAGLWMFSALVNAQSRPPVILVDGGGYNCATAPRGSTYSFGQLERKLEDEGLKVIFFRPCDVEPAPAPLETVGQALGKTIDSLGVPQVDLIVFGAGVGMVRSYLAGKQLEPGVFKPPPDPKVRKLVLLEVPNFGGDPANDPHTPDVQVMALWGGSQFLWDLNTWNQGTDDLRQVDAVVIAGNLTDFDLDGLTQSSILPYGYPDERMRIIPLCIWRPYCSQFVSYINSDSHPSWRIIKSFLSGTDEWRTVGLMPSQEPVLSTQGGLLLAVKNASDSLIPVDQVSVTGVSVKKGSAAFFNNYVRMGDYVLQADAPAPVPPLAWRPAMGGFSVATMKPGPLISAVIPAGSATKQPGIPAGGTIEILGARLGTGDAQKAQPPFPTKLGATEVTLNDEPILLMYVSESRIKARLPEGITGFARLNVNTSQGNHGWNFFLNSPRLVIPHIADGGSWRTTLILSNPTAQSADYEVNVNAFRITTSSGETESGLKGTLPAGGSATLASSGTRDLAQAIADITTGGALVANAVFSTTQGDSTVEAAAPAFSLAARSLLLPFDNENGNSTLVALANTGRWSATATLTFRSPDGSVFSVETLPLNAGTKIAFNMADRFPQAQNKTGTLTIAAGAPLLAALGLKFLPEGTFSTLPVYVLGEFAPADSRQILSHVIDGGTWQSAMTIVNLDSQPADYQLRIFDNAGSPLGLNWNGVDDSELSGTLAPLSSTTLKTPGPSSSLSEGWAEIKSNGRLGAHLVFTQTAPNGSRFEAAVPAMGETQSAVSVPYDNTGSVITKIAVLNPGTALAATRITVRDEQGEVIGTGTIPLEPGAKKVFALPDLVGSSGQNRGLLQMGSDSGAIAAIALRCNGPAFTTVPAAAIDAVSAP